MAKAYVLVVDDEPDIRQLLREIARGAGLFRDFRGNILRRRA